MSESIKSKILSYLTEKNKFVAGGTLERTIGAMAMVKDSNVSRRCRELAKEGKLEVIYEKLPNVTNRVVYYRISQEYRTEPKTIAGYVNKIYE